MTIAVLSIQSLRVDLYDMSIGIDDVHLRKARRTRLERVLRVFCVHLFGGVAM